MRIPNLATKGLSPRPRPATPLAEVSFTPNPGHLRAFASVPRPVRGAPLVVLLHGCGQTAAGYDAGTGWSQLAAEHGFALLALEQSALNNPATCFNWFVPGDITRGEGEVESIAAAIRHMVSSHRLDASRVFITGLSAGGAMTAAMLACYPELFAGGAIIAGLPFGAAHNVREALEAMKIAPVRTGHAWGEMVRAASPHDGAWPRISIWHGDADATVTIDNAKALAAQWADVQGLRLKDAHHQKLGHATRLHWGDKLEVVTVPGLGHGVPIESADVGAAMPYILDAGISSTRRIAQFFGLLDAAEVRPTPAPVHTPTPVHAPTVKIEAELMVRQPPALEKRIDGVIRRALKAAGLLRRR